MEAETSTPSTDCREQVSAAHAALAIGIGQHRWQQRGHGMQHRRFADTVEFLAVHLERVDQCRRGGRQPAAATP